MNSNSIIIVPYRNRASHLAQFLSHMAIHHPGLPICIVEQSVDKPFNRGKLLNIGFLENPGYRYYIFHDVDMLPVKVNYNITYNAPVVQLARSEIQLFEYLGGVTRFGYKGFKNAGGYHNDYFSRAEDNEMRFNLKRLLIGVIEKPGVFTFLDHERNGPEFDPVLFNRAQKKREVQNQLSVCTYRLLETKTFDRVKHITAALVVLFLVSILPHLPT